MARELDARTAEELGHGLVAGGAEERAEADDLAVAETLAVDLGLEEAGDEAIVRLLAERREELLPVAHEVGHRLERVGRDRWRVAVALEGVVHPDPKLPAIVVGYAEEREDHLHGQRRREVLHEVAAALGREAGQEAGH